MLGHDWSYLQNTMEMRVFRIVFALIALIGVVACATDEEPNFIIFLTDDLGYGDPSSYGHPIIQTPNLDRFAEEGVRLTDCHSAGTVCSPSRSGLLTGRHPYRSGFYYIAGGRTFLQDEEITIPELLKTAGYQTAFFGKWHLSRLENEKQPNPGDQGFDYWMATSVNAFEGPRNPLKFIRNGEAAGIQDGWYCDIVVRESLEWLKSLDPEKPFFLEVCTHEPHTPIAPPDSLVAPFLDLNLMPIIRSLNYGGVDREVPDTLLSAANYYATVQQLDHAFGMLLAELKALGLDKNTLVLFTSDNGPEHPVNLEESRGEWDDDIRDQCAGTPGPFRGMKRYPYEGGHRVPGFARWPGKIPAGIVSDKLFNGTDILPIICDLAGVSLPNDRTIDGINSFNALLNKTVQRDKPVLWTFPTHEDTYFRMPHISLRDGNFTLLGWLPEKEDNQKLVEWMKTSIPEKFVLFDVKKDPAQQNDILHEHAELAEKLKEKMVAQWIEIRDEYHLE